MQLAKLLTNRGEFHVVNLDAITEVKKNSGTTCVLYFSSYCLANGQEFVITEEELAALTGTQIILTEAAEAKLLPASEDKAEMEAV
jgi:hypothetical protein